MAGQERIAVLGAGGTMGFPMARNLARAGFAVHAWNRTREKAEPLSEDGAQIASTPAEAADGASVILTMLADTEAVIEAVDGDRGAFSALPPATGSGTVDGVIWLQMSTIGEAGTERCADLAGQRRVPFVDAPVLGTRQPAEERKLVIMASGPATLRNRLQPIFDALGHKTMWVGEAGAGSQLKLVINTWLLTVVEGGAETIALAEGLGLDPHLLFEAIDGGPLDLPYLRMKGQAMMERDFAPSFRLKLAAKDAALAEEAVRRRQLDLPLIPVIQERMAEGAREHGDEDMSATYLTSAPRARQGAYDQ
jgi:3-hydroxyisobutyrate dehydrogenase